MLAFLGPPRRGGREMQAFPTLFRLLTARQLSPEALLSVLEWRLRRSEMDSVISERRKRLS